MRMPTRQCVVHNFFSISTTNRGCPRADVENRNSPRRPPNPERPRLRLKSVRLKRRLSDAGSIRPPRAGPPRAPPVLNARSAAAVRRVGAPPGSRLRMRRLRLSPYRRDDGRRIRRIRGSPDRASLPPDVAPASRESRRSPRWARQNSDTAANEHSSAAEVSRACHVLARITRSAPGASPPPIRGERRDALALGTPGCRLARRRGVLKRRSAARTAAFGHRSAFD
jgi:hypothetical protein